jgi:hypothetical protein
LQSLTVSVRVVSISGLGFQDFVDSRGVPGSAGSGFELIAVEYFSDVLGCVSHNSKAVDVLERSGLFWVGSERLPAFA